MLRSLTIKLPGYFTPLIFPPIHWENGKLPVPTTIKSNSVGRLLSIFQLPRMSKTEFE